MVSIKRRILGLLFAQARPETDRVKPRHIVRRDRMGQVRARERSGAGRTRRIVKRRAPVGTGSPLVTNSGDPVGGSGL